MFAFDWDDVCLSWIFPMEYETPCYVSLVSLLLPRLACMTLPHTMTAFLGQCLDRIERLVYSWPESSVVVVAVTVAFVPIGQSPFCLEATLVE